MCARGRQWPPAAPGNEKLRKYKQLRKNPNYFVKKANNNITIHMYHKHIILLVIFELISEMEDGYQVPQCNG